MPALKNPRRELFCLEYLKDKNATQAAIRAGYSAKTAKQSGHQLLTFTDVKARVAELLQEAFKAVQMDAQEVLARMARIARADVRGAFNPDGTLKSPTTLDDDGAAAIAGIEVVELAGGMKVDAEGGVQHIPMYVKKVRLRDPMPALRTLAEHHELIKGAGEGVDALAGELAEQLKRARMRRRGK